MTICSRVEEKIRLSLAARLLRSEQIIRRSQK
jgi:hypothetical protein